MRLFERTSDIDTAEMRAAAAVDVLAQAQADHAAKTAACEALAAQARSQALDNPTAAASDAGEVSRLRTELELVHGPRVQAAAGRLEVARRDVWRAHGDDRSARASRLEEASRAVRAERDRHLARAAEVEGGVEFHPREPACWGHNPLMHGPVSHRIPRSEALSNGAKALAAQAAELRRVAEECSGELVAGAVLAVPPWVAELEPDK